MKPSFHVRVCNSPFEDPGLLVRVLREGRSLMFDLGCASSLSTRDILKTSDYFVSHTHVDHFIGFDAVLRVSLRKEGPLRFYGPAGFADRVEAKLRSYTWNLTADYPAVIEAYETDGSCIKKVLFRARTSFAREDKGTTPFGGALMRDGSLTVSAVVIDHQIPCLAFSLEEDFHINIDKAALISRGLSVGPWLGAYKKALRKGGDSCCFTIDGRAYSFQELEGIARITRGQKISYVVDAFGSEENIRKIVGLSQGADVLYIETYFLDKDRGRARERYHLTAREAGRIAREAGVGKLEPIHFSPRYTGMPARLVEEAQQEFRG
ncbi:MAG: hypothetical protein JSU90_07015 [Nitrospiraceae bacterium]|nr:MAG: hypothetical protein JSU90_07015 [Nitrospiraceae bacterium]